MKNITKTLFIILLPIFFFACEDVIEVDLENAEPVLVVDAKLYNTPFVPATVNLTESTEYFGEFQYNTVSGAEVKISNLAGDTTVTLEESPDMPGTYTANFFGTSGNTYRLEIIRDGEVYTAESEMPQTVSIDSLTAAPEPSFPYQQQYNEEGEKNYFLHCYTTNPPDVRNFMQFILYINRKPIKSFELFEDRYIDGQSFDYYFFEESINPGDTAMVELRSMNKEGFQYINALSSAAIEGAGGPPTTPFNPKSNISGNTLGFFSALAVDAAVVIAPKNEHAR